MSNIMAKQEEKDQPVAPTQALTLTTEQLVMLINESKKPTAEVQSANDKILAAKKRQAEQELETQRGLREAKLFAIKNCPHTRKDGTSRAAFVKPVQGRPHDYGYFHCQKCHANIFPEQTLQGGQASHVLGTIYDTNLFNKLIHMSAMSNIGD